jgi:hypothetical protein
MDAAWPLSVRVPGVSARAREDPRAESWGPGTLAFMPRTDYNVSMERMRKSGATRNPAGDEKTVVHIIVKTRAPDYVPPGVAARSRIDATMFTAEAPAALLATLDADPEIVSVSPATKLRQIG